MKTKNNIDRSKEVHGLLKIPDNILLKEALVEIGKLKSYIEELEDKNKQQQGTQTTHNMQKGSIESLFASNNALRKQNKILREKIREKGGSFDNIMLEKLESDIIQYFEKRGKKEGNKPLLCTNGRMYTAFELADEIRNRTEFGQKTINDYIFLTIDLVERGKLKAENNG